MRKPFSVDQDKPKLQSLFPIYKTSASNEYLHKTVVDVGEETRSNTRNDVLTMKLPPDKCDPSPCLTLTFRALFQLPTSLPTVFLPLVHLLHNLQLLHTLPQQVEFEPSGGGCVEEYVRRRETDCLLISRILSLYKLSDSTVSVICSRCLVDRLLFSVTSEGWCVGWPLIRSYFKLVVAHPTPEASSILLPFFLYFVRDSISLTVVLS